MKIKLTLITMVVFVLMLFSSAVVLKMIVGVL